MNLVVAGSRTFNDYELLKETILELYDLKDLTIISGAARGADILGEQFSKDYDLELLVMPANWNKHGRSAGYIRNSDMAKEADEAIVFWDGMSKGSENMIQQMKKLDKRVTVIKVGE